MGTRSKGDTRGRPQPICRPRQSPSSPIAIAGPAYMERVELYCDANDVEEDKKVSVLLSLIGAKTYNLLRNLVSPAKPSSKTFDDIQKILQKHLKPKPLVIAERFRFHKRNQAKDESISDYMAELRKLSKIAMRLYPSLQPVSLGYT